MTIPELSGIAIILQYICGGMVVLFALLLLQGQRIIKQLDRLISITSKEDEIRKIDTGNVGPQYPYEVEEPKEFKDPLY